MSAKTVDDTHVLDFAQMKLSQVSQEIELAEHKFPPAKKNPDEKKQAEVEKKYGEEDEVTGIEEITIKTTKNEEEEHDSGEEEQGKEKKHGAEVKKRR